MIPHSPRTIRISRLSLAVAGLLAVSSSALAQATWNATTDGNWSSPGQWVGGTPPVEGSTTTVTFTPSTAVGASFAATIDDAIAGASNSPFELNVLNLNGTGDNDGALETITINSASGTTHSLSFTGASGTNIINYGVSNTTSPNNTTLKYTLNSVTTNTTLTIQGSGGTAGSGNTANALRMLTVTGAGSVTKSGTGRVEFDGTTNFSGGLNVTAGRLTINNASSAGWSGGTNVSGGELVLSRNIGSATGLMTLSGGTVTFLGLNGAGTFRDVAASVLVSSDSVRFVNSNIQGSGGALSLNGSVDLGGSSSRVIQVNNIVTNNTVDNNVLRIAGVLSNGGIIKTGLSRLVLSNAANTYTGDTVVRQGTLIVEANAGEGVNGALGNSTTPVQLGDTSTSSANTINLMTSGAFQIDRQISVNNQNATGVTSIGSTTTTGTSTYTNTITLNKSVNLASHASGGNTGTVEFSGLIADGSASSGVTIGAASQGGNGLGIVKFTRSGGNTYTGNTVVNSGTFLVQNTTGSATGTGNVTIAATATLGGSGRISGAVTLQNGSTVSPGNSPGALSSGNLILNDGGNYNWQIADATGAAGTGFDTINVTGTLDLTALTGTADYNVNLWSLSGIGPDVNGNANNFNSSLSQYWTLISTTGGVSGFDASEFTINIAAFNGTGGFSNGLDGGTFSLSVVGNDLRLNFTAVPEPSTCLLVGIGLMVFAARRKNRPINSV